MAAMADDAASAPPMGLGAIVPGPAPSSMEVERRLADVEQREDGILAIAKLANEVLPLPAALTAIRQVAQAVMAVERLEFATYDGISSQLFPLAPDAGKAGFGDGVPIEQLQGSLAWHLVHDRRPWLGDATNTGPAAQLHPNDGDGQRWLGVPVLANDQVLGVVSAWQALDAPPFDDDDMSFLEFVAGQARVVIERQQVQRQIEEKLQERTQHLILEVEDRQRSEGLQAALYSIAELSNASGLTGDYFAAVHDIIGGVIDCRNICIAQLSADERELQFPYYVDDQQPIPTSRSPGHGATEYVLRTRSPLRLDLGSESGKADAARLLSIGAVGNLPSLVNAWLGVPLICANRVVGVLSIQTYEPDSSYGERDQEFLAFIAYQIGHGLERQQAAAALRAANSALEQRVSERTLQLQKQMEARDLIEQRLKHEALHDFLTGLPNRAFLCDRLLRSLALQARDPDKMFAVMFMDLDRFKVINDSAGHLVGDALLKEVARRLGGCVRVPDMVARLGGDEFAILVENIRSVETVVRIAKRIIKSLQEPIIVDGKELFTAASIGIAISDPWYKEPEELLRDADIAMYRAKANDQQRFEIFNESLHQEALRVLEIEGDLRRAIANREFEPYFQSIVRLDDGATIGYESLLRWNHPQLGVLAPNAFLSIAEASGSLEAIDWQMFDLACAAVPELVKPGQYVNLNFSPRHFRDKDMDVRLLKLLEDRGVRPDQVRIEVTEGTLIENPDQVSAIIDRLHQAGVMTSLDDFGTGYSSLSYLHRFRLHAVKIDRSFVTPLMPGGGGSSEAVVRAILALSKSQGLSVIAEGIETTQQRDALVSLGCDYGQGYLYSRPQQLLELAS